jgi:carbonic anhydrase
LKEPVEASREQLDTIRSVLGFDNNRPVQPQNSRLVIGW